MLCLSSLWTKGFYHWLKWLPTLQGIQEIRYEDSFPPSQLRARIGATGDQAWRKFLPFINFSTGAQSNSLEPYHARIDENLIDTRI